MVDERVTLTIDENGTISCKTDGFDHSTMDSMDLLDALLKDLVDELPEKQRLEGGTK
jgi:hypothetical protein